MTHEQITLGFTRAFGMAAPRIRLRACAPQGGSTGRTGAERLAVLLTEEVAAKPGSGRRRMGF
jgi:hypothetical protein